MRNKMLAIAIAASLAATSFSAFAAPQSSSGSNAEEIALLKAQLATLQAKVDELEQNSQTNAALQAKVAQLEQDSQTDAQQAITTQQALTQMQQGDWANNTKISGTSFIDFTNIDQTKNGTKTDSSGTGLDVKRFYLQVDHKFNDIWSADLTTDFNYVSSDSETQLFVKKAYLQGAFSPMATLRVGSAGMAWIPFVEDYYGYRFVENTFIDRLKFGSSADWGLHLLGDNGVFNYQASVVNGGGYKNPTRSDSVDFEGRIGVQPVKGLVIAVGGYSGDLGKDTQSTPAIHTANRYDAMIAYKNDSLRVGAEWFRANNWNNVLSTATDSADGYSMWASYDWGAASLFARYDHADMSKQLDPSLTDKYYNFGVGFPITKGVRIAVAYKDETLQDNSSTDTKTKEFGVWSEVKF